MKKLTVILDPAHGVDVLGKCSPDGKHKEYLWSRERVRSIKQKLEKKGFSVFVTNPTDKEIGLTKRKQFAVDVKGNNKILISLHNNAKGIGKDWNDARGVAIYTTKGITQSDKYAEMMLEQFSKDFPLFKIRRYSNEKLGGDFEENFTVLMGSGYSAMLIEWLFQDNALDVALLSDDTVNSNMEDSIVKVLEDIERKL